MVVLTKEQWFEKIKGWLPSWYLTDNEKNVVVLKAIARVFAAAQQDAVENFDETFIDKSSDEILSMHGKDRNVERASEEAKSSFKIRIKSKSLVSNVDIHSLKSIVDALLVNGVSQVRPDYLGSVFFNRECFFNRGEILQEPIENTFTIVVDQQVHDPYSFFNRECFFNRSDFIGDSESNLQVFKQILEAINENKAFGTLFRIIERLG